MSAFGRQVGGGAPIRDEVGQVVSQHVPFSSQSKKNGGIEFKNETPEKKGSRKNSYSPSRVENVHMRPSNHF
jgi:hypothetical protein